MIESSCALATSGWLNITWRAKKRGLGFDRLADHFSRHGVDRRFADGQRQTGPRHRADALAGGEADAGAGRAKFDASNNHGAMGDVGIVAGVLDDSGAAKVLASFLQGEGEGGRLAAGQTDRNRIGKGTARQGGKCGARRRRRAGAGRPSAPQLRFFPLVHGPCYRVAAAAPKEFLP